jgi:hypothetical protein
MSARSREARGLAHGVVGPARVIAFGVSNVAPADVVISVLVIAACSGSFVCASGIRNASQKPPSTSSPRPICACSASPPTKPLASPLSPSRTPAPGNTRDDAVGRLVRFPEP